MTTIDIVSLVSVGAALASCVYIPLCFGYRRMVRDAHCNVAQLLACNRELLAKNADPIEKLGNETAP